ncbi:MAG: hypothetical protein ACTHJ0_04875 [Flavipsychrobacter sp.]
MVFLNLPGSPVPVWLVFLLPIAVILLLIKGAQLLFHWLIARFSRRHKDGMNTI